MKGRPGEIRQLSCADEASVLEGWAWRVTEVGCASLHKSLVIASCLCPTDGFKLSRSKGRAISSVLLNAWECMLSAWEAWCMRWNIQFIGRCLCLWRWVFWSTPYPVHITCWLCVWKVLLYRSSPSYPCCLHLQRSENLESAWGTILFGFLSVKEKSSCFSFKHAVPRFWGVTVLWKWILLCQYKATAAINDVVFMGLSNLM